MRIVSLSITAYSFYRAPSKASFHFDEIQLETRWLFPSIAFSAIRPWDELLSSFIPLELEKSALIFLE